MRSNAALTESDLEERFVESVQELGEDEVKILGLTYSGIELVRKADPIAFREAFNNWLDYELTDGELFEAADGQFYDQEPSEEDE